MAAISILLWGIVFMEQSIEYIRSVLQSLVWDKGKDKEKEADEVSMILQLCKEWRAIGRVLRYGVIRPTSCLVKS